MNASGGRSRADEIVAGILSGDRRSISRAISLVEDESLLAPEIMRAIHQNTGRAHVIGITGPPGVGKSTMVDALAALYRREGKTVGIVAVDPTSPFTGGALLGDRIRMQRHTLDPGVFVRSLATRGRVGGLSAATASAARILDASGKHVVLVETVGAGQSEVEIMKLAQTVIVVLAPGLGDDIQAIKAGILEIADIMVVNKADLEGADKTCRELEMALDLRGNHGWRPPVLQATARAESGVTALADKAGEHLDYMRENGVLFDRQRRAALAEVQEIVTRRLLLLVGGGEEWPKADPEVLLVALKKIDPYSAADKLIEAFIKRLCTHPVDEGATR